MAAPKPRKRTPRVPITQMLGAHEARLVALEQAQARVLDELHAIRASAQHVERMVVTHVERLRGGWKVLTILGAILLSLVALLGRLWAR